ncbi:MAG: MFS transporter, partial [Aeromicrobium sp.]
MSVSATTAPPAAKTRTGAFALAIAAVLALMIGASAPSPFYPVLQQELGFSAATMTGIFAVYAVALLLTLLVSGSISDHLGRRPVISAGFVVLAVSMVAFWHADSVSLLFVARIVQGAAAGLLMSSLSAAVVDLEPPSRPGSAASLNSISPLGGLAAGALLAGLLLDQSSSALAVVFGTLTGT